MRTLRIVDDNPQNLYMLQVLLSTNGFHVVQASNGAEALEQARRSPPDMIISDILMPVMDGFALCRAWKEDERLRGIPFVFYTATYTDPKDEAFALSLGADRFIVKPVEPNEFLALLLDTMKNFRPDKPVAASQPVEESEYFRQYNEALIRKLEDKMLQLEQANRSLERDIAERKQAEKALAESEAKIRSILDNIEIGVALISPNMEILEMNRRMREWFPGVDLAQHPLCYRAFNDPPRDLACSYCPTSKTLQDGQIHEATRQAAGAGAERSYRIVSSPVFNTSGEVAAAIELVEDITERLSLESQLRQAQKMEAVGRLAGGVAHDFNNMLGVIIGNAELALGQSDSTQPLFGILQEIRKAAWRSADLTRQLLAFARKQTIAPRVLDLNETVGGMLKMLRRLIGEDIDLAWLPGPGVCQVKMDPAQIDQILANLCVNARDAISGVGKITIETNAVSFDGAYRSDLTGVMPGEYVMLAVSDDGCGMDKETLGKLFEPFFTTKEVGKGTGLGLATVYGIVKQNNGFIDVYSEPGHGTSFKIYLPRHAAKTEQIPEERPAVPASKAHETLLLVEDEPAILDMTKHVLEGFGYRVLGALTPAEAIRMAKEHAGKIHLLMTDMVMPEMNGRDLAKNIASLCPGIRHVFMSGYTDSVVARHGVLEEGVNYIQKPFSMQTLAAKVREVLDGE